MQAKLHIAEFDQDAAVLSIKTRDVNVLVCYRRGPIAAVFDGKGCKFLLNDLSLAQRRIAEGFLSSFSGETKVVTSEFFNHLLQVQFSLPEEVKW